MKNDAPFRALVFFLLIFCAGFYAAAEEISFTADTMSGRAGSKEDMTRLSGNARVQTETIEIRADEIELSGKEFRYVGGRGNISGSYKESDLEFECAELKYDRNSKIVTLSGDVKLKDLKNNVTASAQMIEYNSNTDIAVMQIEVRLEQKKNVCTSAYAVYRKKEQMLELNGSAKVVQDDDSFAAQSITFNMDTEEIQMDGNVHGSVTDDGTKSPKDSGGDASEGKNDSAEKKDEEGGEEKPADSSGDSSDKTESAESADSGEKADSKEGAN